MKAQLPILLVEDDECLREALSITLDIAKVKHIACGSAEEALEMLLGNRFAMMVSDFRLPGIDGLALLQQIRQRAPDLPVVLMSAFADASLAVRALKSGACDFLIKPFTPQQLTEVIERHRRQVVDPGAGSSLVAVAPAMRAVLARCERVAGTDASVLLTGESGVGKDVLARHLHQVSRRAGKPYVAINCAAIPEALLESLLFGYEKGAFTGAARSQAGKFEQADGGTLFLDEIGEMPVELQAKLLRVLQDKMIERLGSNRLVETDVRVIAATNRDLSESVAAGRFREDLFFRLAVFPVRIPPLRERREDILPLARSFMERYRNSMGRPGITLSESAERVLQAHPWPGNVRELENAIQRGLLLCDDGLIEPAHMELAGQAIEPVVVVSVPPSANIGVRLTPPLMEEGANMSDLERSHILRVLSNVSGSRKKATEVLGISERTLRNKLKSYREQGFAV